MSDGDKKVSWLRRMNHFLLTCLLVCAIVFMVRLILLVGQLGDGIVVMSKDLAKMSSTPGGLSLDVTDISDDQVDDALRQADQARRTAMSMIETLMGSMSGTNDLNGVLDDLLEGFAHEPL